ncbi:MAG: ATP-dependent endonuclease [Leptolyngbyaceae cyanobacterium]
MAKIHSLRISNFRSIKGFEQVFGSSDFICIIGRGDSGKTTILDAISYVLSPHWNLSILDTDFYECNVDESIEIEVSVYDLPPNLIREDKYGLYIRGLNPGDYSIHDEIQDEHVALLTIKLCVSRDLEPTWHVVNSRQEPVEIKARDRAKLNVFLVSDYIDRHFSWNRGNPLYSLLRQEEDWQDEQEKNILIEALREAKNTVDNSSFSHLKNVTERVIENALELGIEIGSASTTIDSRDFLMKDGKVCLHEGKVPFRLKGKGSKRLISIAVQTELSKAGGIILIDEIEHGLEPDRVQHLTKTLRDNNQGQIFITTHSRDVLVELGAQNLFLMRKEANSLQKISSDNDFQKCVRNNPEAFFAKSILVCEGATEIGICRALNDYRIQKGKQSAAIKGIRFVDGTGSELVNYVRRFQELGYNTCLFCDSDDNKGVNPQKDELSELGITIVDCSSDNSIEMQFFDDLPWPGVQDLVKYHLNEAETSIESLTTSLRTKIPDLSENWLEANSVNTENEVHFVNVRGHLGKISSKDTKKKKAWFKRIDHGIFLGETCCKYLQAMEGKVLKDEFEKLSEWINNA